MKKIGFLFLLFFILLFGMSLAAGDTDSQATNVKDKIEDYEKNITEGKNITSTSDNVITPSIANSAAKTCENAVNSIIEKLFGLLK